MHKPVLTSLAFLMVLTGRPVYGCKCAGRASVCGAVQTSDAVFIGTAESVEPRSLDPYDPATRRLWKHTQEEVERLTGDKSAAGLAKLKEAYLLMLPGLLEPYRSRLEHAATSEQLETIFHGLVENGRRTRFIVEETFRGGTKSSIEVWSDFSDCGFAFQIGETYLVYANLNEAAHRLETGACSRTSRLSDAGADLAYLFLLERGGADSGRLAGFVTSDESDIMTARFWDFIHNPVRGTFVEIEFAKGFRYTFTDQQGRFSFDGLAAGDYNISTFHSDYPEPSSLAGAPKVVHLKPNGCATEVILARPRDR